MEKVAITKNYLLPHSTQTILSKTAKKKCYINLQFTIFIH